jgi:LDH2 family malate/lactate/ureidoglycolate dehydrogenase
VKVSSECVRQQILAILRSWGMAEDLATTTADAMVETDLMGIDSHGLSMLMMYERMQSAGQLDLDARPRVLRDLGATALVDGGANLGHPVAVMAMRLAVQKALAPRDRRRRRAQLPPFRRGGATTRGSRRRKG